jgi:hypothetical protein
MFRADGQDDIGLACEMVGGARPRTPTMPGAQGWSWERLALPAIVSATGIPRRIAKSASAPPPANSARRRHGADPMGRASIRPAPLGLMAPIGAGSSTAARDRWSAASEGPLSHFLTERAPLKPLSNRLTLGKRRRSFRVTTPSRRRRLSTEKCEPSRGDWSSAAMQPSRRGRRKRPISMANYAALATMDCRAETRHLWGAIASRPAQNGSTSHGGVTTTFQSLPKSCYRHSLNCDTVVIWRMSIKSGLTSR